MVAGAKITKVIKGVVTKCTADAAGLYNIITQPASRGLHGSAEAQGFNRFTQEQLIAMLFRNHTAGRWRLKPLRRGFTG